MISSARYARRQISGPPVAVCADTSGATGNLIRLSVTGRHVRIHVVSSSLDVARGRRVPSPLAAVPQFILGLLGIRHG